MVPPNPGNLVDHRFQRVRIRCHQSNGEVRRNKCISQGGERDCQEDRLQQCSRFGHGNPCAPAPVGTYKGQHRLQAGNGKCQYQGKMSDLDDHGQNLVRPGRVAKCVRQSVSPCWLASEALDHALISWIFLRSGLGHCGFRGGFPEQFVRTRFSFPVRADA